MSFRLWSGAARGRASLLTAISVAGVLTTLAPLEALAQGMPVFRDSTQAIREPHPGVTNARHGVQIDLVDPVTAWRSLLPGNAIDGVTVRASNAEQEVYHYHPAKIQAVGAWASNASGGAARVDTTGLLPWKGAKRLEAWVSWTPGPGASAIAFAVEVRKHRVANADSTTTFVWQPHRSAAPGAASPTLPDTLGLPSVWAIRASNPDTLLFPGEFVVVVGGTLQPRFRAIPINLYGQDVGDADFLSVRVRPVNTWGSSGNFNGPLNEQAMSYAWTFVGYR